MVQQGAWGRGFGSTPRGEFSYFGGLEGEREYSEIRGGGLVDLRGNGKNFNEEKRNPGSTGK